MRILFDQGTPVPLRRLLPGHEVSTAYAQGWSNFQNGDLLAMAEGRFDLLITTDKNLRYQQDLRGRTPYRQASGGAWRCGRALP